MSYDGIDYDDIVPLNEFTVYDVQEAVASKVDRDYVTPRSVTVYQEDGTWIAYGAEGHWVGHWSIGNFGIAILVHEDGHTEGCVIEEH